MPLFVIFDRLRELRDEGLPLGPWPDKIHIATQDVPELGNLVHANLSNDAPDARHALIRSLGPDGPVLLCVNAHRTKLYQGKETAVFADAFLLIKDWTARLDLDQDRGRDHDGEREDTAE